MRDYVVKGSVGLGQIARGLRRVYPFLAIAAGLGFVAGYLPADFPSGGLIAGVVFSALWLAVEMRPQTALRVGPEGLDLEGQRVPWRSIGRVVVTRQNSDDYSAGDVGVSVGYRTEDAAPALPDVPLHTAVPAGKANVGQLLRAVRAHALPETEVREETAQRPSGRLAEGGPARAPTGPYVLKEASSPKHVARRFLWTARAWWATFVVVGVLTAILRLGIIEQQWQSLLRTAAVLAGVVLLVVLLWDAWPKTVLRVVPSGVELPAGSIPGLAREFRADRIPWPTLVLESVTIPWRSIWQVVVVYPESGSPGADSDQPIEIGLRPRQDAALPGHVAVCVTESSDPLAIPPRLRVSVRRAPVDVQALVTAVRAYAMENTAVVGVRGGAERTLG